MKTKKITSYLVAAILICSVVTGTFAGNPDRAGQAGGTQLLINPWARSAGWGAANTANSVGLESMFTNIAGIAFTKKTEAMFARTSIFGNAGININAFGFTQKIGETGALGLSIMNIDYGNIMITTVDNPEGNIGTFSPSFINIGVSYAKGFSDNIFGGFTVRGISEGISSVQARGLSLDAGIQYLAGKNDQVHFGVAIKNVGPKMSYNGDGLSFKTPLPQNNPGGTKTFTVEQSSAGFELPSLLNIGGAYDFYIANDSLNLRTHRLTVAANFTSNSFTRDQFQVGVEYAWKSILMVRGGYIYEDKVASTSESATMYAGPSGGVTVEIPFNKNKSTFAIDYSYRHTNYFTGIHSFGARINL